MRHKRLILFALAVLAAGAFIWHANRRPAVRNAAPRGSTVVAFGDSLTAGYGAPEGRGLVGQLEDRLGVSIVNAGRPGDTTASALERLQRDVLARDPKVVVVGFGGNDMLARTPAAETKRNLERIVDAVQARGAAVVLFGVAGPFGYGDLDETVEEISRSRGTGCVPNLMAGVYGRASLMSDRIHPNAAGYGVMAERLAEEMRRALPAVFP